VASLHVAAVNEAVVERVPYNLGNAMNDFYHGEGRVEQSLEYVWNIR
jgi:hypothetical protein